VGKVEVKADIRQGEEVTYKRPGANSISLVCGTYGVGMYGLWERVCVCVCV
jgi:hypothetical protein